MENATWMGFVAIALVVLNVLNLYNSAHTAKRNANEPFERLDVRVKEVEKHLTHTITYSYYWCWRYYLS